MRRALFACLGLGLAAGAAYERLRGSEPDRIDVYFDDGSFVTYVDGSSAAERLLPSARAVLAAVAA